MDKACEWCSGDADKYMSGQAICWPCWYWVKLDEPAARHWARVAREFLSNVDTYDATKFMPAVGLTSEQFTTMLDSAERVLRYSDWVLTGPPAKREPMERKDN